MLTPLPPARVRLHPDDHEQYGGEWVAYDEAAIARLPVRELIAIEAEIGMAVVGMMAQARVLDGPGWTAATLAQIWVARRMAGVVEAFVDFAPLVLLARWESAPAGDADPPAQTSSASPSEE